MAVKAFSPEERVLQQINAFHKNLGHTEIFDWRGDGTEITTYTSPRPRSPRMPPYIMITLSILDMLLLLL